MESQRDELRLDVDTLRALLDAALDRGAAADDLVLIACSQALRTRRRRLADLERVRTRFATRP